MFYLLLILTLCLPGSGWAQTAVLGQAANPPDATLYDYRNTIRLQDDFIVGTVTSGNIGALQWNTGNGAASTWAAASSGVIGGFIRDTSATINTAAYTILANANILDPASPYTELFRLKMGHADTDTIIWVGAANNSTSVTPADGIYIEKRAADTNWFCVTRASSSQTRTDSGVAVSTANYQTLQITRTSVNVKFSVNGALVCTHTATIPTASLDPGFVISNAAAAAKTVTVDYFEMVMTGLSR